MLMIWKSCLFFFSILKQVLISSLSVIGLAIAFSSQRLSSADLLPSLSCVAQAGFYPYPGVVGHRLSLPFLDFISVFSDFSVLPVTSGLKCACSHVVCSCHFSAQIYK